MNNKTIRWITNLLMSIGTGFMVTGMATLFFGQAINAGSIVVGATMISVSLFVIVVSYVVAMLEVEE